MKISEWLCSLWPSCMEEWPSSSIVQMSIHFQWLKSLNFLWASFCLSYCAWDGHSILLALVVWFSYLCKNTILDSLYSNSWLKDFVLLGYQLYQKQRTWNAWENVWVCLEATVQPLVILLRPQRAHWFNPICRGRYWKTETQLHDQILFKKAQVWYLRHLLLRFYRLWGSSRASSLSAYLPHRLFNPLAQEVELLPGLQRGY